MADIKSGEPFGLDNSFIAKIDWDLALSRVIHDMRSDFIFAPHLRYICGRASNEIIDQLKADLKSGTFSPSVPITMEVPKSYCMRVVVPSRRGGPPFSRPGSILLPRDRLFYQALADQAAPIIESRTDKARSFSHRLAESGSANMFQPTRTCWSNLQKALSKHTKSRSSQYILKIDVANFFGSLNQHTMINILNDAGYPKSLSSRLEAILISYTGERSSRGILQGMYPSDLLGNHYMAPIDEFLEEYGVPSARYVDDIYIFVESVDAADKLVRELIPHLRGYDLVLNEAKSVVMPKASLLTEEPDLEALFSDAVEEISKQVDDTDFDADYGFQSEWDENEGEDDKGEELELEATKILFDSLSDYPGQEENIERFCLPLFSKAGSDYAVAHVLDAFKKRASMSQIYASYLSKFLENKDVTTLLTELLADSSLTDWQKMWVLAALMQKKPISDGPIRVALKILKDATRHDALRAVAAIYVGRFGDHARRKNLFSIYPTVSSYTQAAIYFSSRTWPAVERSNAKASWGAHGQLNTLLTIAINKPIKKKSLNE
jgi:hypothetical protein